MSDAELLQLVSGKPLDFEPGADWRYSNTNYYLLGMIMAQASGQSYAAFMQDEFFTPLGLAHTRYGSEARSFPIERKPMPSTRTQARTPTTRRSA